MQDHVCRTLPKYIHPTPIIRYGMDTEKLKHDLQEATLLLLMTVTTKALLALVSCYFMTFTLLTARHSLNDFV